MKQEFYKQKLQNGVTVLFEKRKLPIVAVSTTAKFGSAHELEHEKGWSHFLEHMMFKGTKTRSQQQIANEIEKKGGVINAFTGEDITTYWNKLPSKHLFSALNITSDLILNPKLSETEFEKEKNVIIEEINMYRDNPMMHGIMKIKELLYKKPFGMSIAGTREIIKNLKIADFKNFFKKNYSTDNMILAVVGDADFEELVKFTEKTFPTTKSQIIKPTPKKINKEEVEKRKNLEQAHYIFGFHAPSQKEKQRYNYEILKAYLFGGMSSRLFQEIREKRALAYAIKGDLDLGEDYGYCFIYAGTLKEKIPKIKEIILREIKNLKNLTQKDLNHYKEQLIGLNKLESEDSSNTMISLISEEAAGNAEEHYKYEEMINNVKLEEVKKIAQLKGFSTFSLIPE